MADRQRDWQADRQVDSQTDRQRDRQTNAGIFYGGNADFIIRSKEDKSNYRQ